MRTYLINIHPIRKHTQADAFALPLPLYAYVLNGWSLYATDSGKTNTKADIYDVIGLRCTKQNNKRFQ